MEKARNSSALKMVCYIMIPILVGLTVLSIMHIVFLSEFGNKKEEVNYLQTENFANNYLYFFIDKIYDCQPNRRETRFDELQDEEGEFYCYFEEESSYHNMGIGNYIKYIIIVIK